MQWNIGDSPVIDAGIAPHPSNPTGVATTVTCTFTMPDATTSVVVMDDTGTTTTDSDGTERAVWRCTGPTITQTGRHRAKVTATAGLIGAENAVFVVQVD